MQNNNIETQNNHKETQNNYKDTQYDHRKTQNNHKDIKNNSKKTQYDHKYLHKNDYKMTLAGTCCLIIHSWKKGHLLDGCLEKIITNLLKKEQL